MSAINVNSITGRTGTHGPVLTGVTTATNGLNVTGGSVGIGTDNPSGKLNIVGSDSQLLNLAQDSGDLAIRLNDRGTGSAYIKVPDNSSASLTFETGGSERLRITSAGLVGIGTDTPTKALQISQNSDCAIRIDANNSNANARTWEIIVGGNPSNNAEMVFRTRQDDGTGGSECVRFTRSGVIKLPSGGGIDFSASEGAGASSSLLDDYEEGNFTPVLGYSNTTALSNVTYVRRSGTYIKAGAMVWFTLDIASSIAWGSIGAVANPLQIQGLPFQCDAVAPAQTGSTFISVMCVPRHWQTPWPVSQSPSNDPPNWRLGHTDSWLTNVVSRNDSTDYGYSITEWDAAAGNGTKQFEIQLYGVYSTTS